MREVPNACSRRPRRRTLQSANVGGFSRRFRFFVFFYGLRLGQPVGTHRTACDFLTVRAGSPAHGPGPRGGASEKPIPQAFAFFFPRAPRDVLPLAPWPSAVSRTRRSSPLYVFPQPNDSAGEGVDRSSEISRPSPASRGHPVIRSVPASVPSPGTRTTRELPRPSVPVNIWEPRPRPGPSVVSGVKAKLLSGLPGFQGPANRSVSNYRKKSVQRCFLPPDVRR